MAQERETISLLMLALSLFGLKQSWEAKTISGSGIVYLWWAHIAAVCWGYWWLPASQWQDQAVSSAADLAGASLGAALPATIFTEGVIVLVRLLLHDRRQRILKEGREEGREEGIEKGREEERQKFLEAAASVISEEDLERIKERLRQSQRS